MFLRILRTPGVLPIYLTSYLSRLPAGAIGLLYVLRTRELTGSYGAGGLVSGAFVLALGLGSPLWGRLVDRRGQGRPLVVSGLLNAVAIAAFAALPHGTPLGLAMLVAAAAGATTSPVGACQRAIWQDHLDPALRHGAYTLDSVIFEVVYISGPLVLVALIGATWSLQAAVVAAALFCGGGTLAFAATRLSREWRPHGDADHGRLGPLRSSGVQTILLTVGLFGLSIAAAEIGLAAFAQRHGVPHAVGFLLALWGIGSMLGGVVVGHLPPPPDRTRRMIGFMTMLAICEVPLVAAGSPVAMGFAITLAGVAIAPGLSLAFQILAEVAPPGTVTEAQSWSVTAMGAGIAVGSAVGGWLVDGPGTRAAFALVVAAGALSAAVLAARRATLHPRTLVTA
jgi:predicted MFS family arabinose efflux permease